MELPSLTTLRQILDRLKANDIAWFKDQWKSGSFGWMKDKLPSGEYEQIGSRVEAGDLNPLKGALSKIDLPGIDLFKGLAGNVTGAAGAAAGVAGAAAVGGAAKIAGAAKVGTNTAKTTATKTTAVVEETKKKSPLIWAIPALIGVAALAFALSRCGSKSATVADTTVGAGESTVAAVETSAAVETTVAAAPAAETTVAAAPAAETTVAAAEPTSVAAATETTAAGAAPAAAGGDILATAAGAGKFNTLAAAVKAAGLSETLQGAGPFTVFAPTDDAFAKLPAGLVDALLKPENKDALTKVLTYHVVPGKVMSTDVKPGAVKTVEGEELTVTVDGDKVKINDANVTSVDVAASNGVIHVLDSVLVPPSLADKLGGLLGTPAAAADTTVAAAAAAPVATPENLTVYFANASAKINGEAKAKIDGAVEQLKALPAGTTVLIVGHASKTGDSAKNEKLSLLRANNVKDALTEGLGESKASNINFKVEFRGDSQPDEDEAKSRKVTIEIQPKK